MCDLTCFMVPEEHHSQGVMWPWEGGQIAGGVLPSEDA